MEYQMNTNQNNKILRIYLAAISAASFIAISFLVGTESTAGFDQVICDWIYRLRTTSTTSMLRAITYTGNWQTVSMICLLFLFLRPTRFSFGVPLSITCILSVTLQNILKYIFHRPRPLLAEHLISQGGYSFPSGHSFTVLVFYGFLIFLILHHLKPLWLAKTFALLLCILVIAIGFSRIYLGVHYPTDVLGGWAIGTLLLNLFSWFWSNLDKKKRASIASS